MAGAREVRKGNFHTIIAVRAVFHRTQHVPPLFHCPTRERVGVLRDHAIDGQRPNQFGPNRTGSQPTGAEVRAVWPVWESTSTSALRCLSSFPDQLAKVDDENERDKSPSQARHNAQSTHCSCCCGGFAPWSCATTSQSQMCGGRVK